MNPHPPTQRQQAPSPWPPRHRRLEELLLTANDREDSSSYSSTPSTSTPPPNQVATRWGPVPTQYPVEHEPVRSEPDTTQRGSPAYLTVGPVAVRHEHEFWEGSPRQGPPPVDPSRPRPSYSSGPPPGFHNPLSWPPLSRGEESREPSALRQEEGPRRPVTPGKFSSPNSLVVDSDEEVDLTEIHRPNPGAGRDWGSRARVGTGHPCLVQNCHELNAFPNLRGLTPAEIAKAKRRRRLKPRIDMLTSTRKTLGELLVFVSEHPGAVRSNRSLVLTTMEYLRFLCQSLSVNKMILQVEKGVRELSIPLVSPDLDHTAPAPTEELKQLEKFQQLYLKLVGELEREKGDTWCVPFRPESEEDYWKARTNLENHLRLDWDAAQQKVLRGDTTYYWGQGFQDLPPAPHLQ